MARPASPSGPRELIDALVRTREALERLVAQLDAQKSSPAGLTVADEQVYRRSKRAVRKINSEHLPWARSPALTADRAAAVSFWLIGIWSSLPLDDSESDR
jgi:hypothetical protein